MALCGGSSSLLRFCDCVGEAECLLEYCACTSQLESRSRASTEGTLGEAVEMIGAFVLSERRGANVFTRCLVVLHTVTFSSGESHLIMDGSWPRANVLPDDYREMG